MTDQFEKLDKIGRGQSTVVWTGWDVELERSVAIKELDESAREDARKVQAFLTEARYVASLDYESLLNVYDIDEPKRMVVTELLEGSLEDLVHREPMPPYRVRAVLQQALRALNYLHGKGVLYGQVRPGKMLYSRRGRLKLGSFQRAELHGPVPPEVEKYAAPEAIDAKFGDVGPTLDLYCLGFVALELLLGPKFDELFPVMSGDQQMSGLGWLRWHTSDETLPPTASLAPRAPADVATLLDALLRKQASDRPQTASAAYAMLSDLPLVPIVDGGEDSLLGGQFVQEPRDAPKRPTEPTAPVIGAPDAAAPQPSAPPTPRKKTGAPAKKSSANPSGVVSRPQSKSSGAKPPWMTVALGAGVMALVALIAFGLWALLGWGSSNVVVEFKFQPASSNVIVKIDGEKAAPDESGGYPVTPGEHQFQFEAKEGTAEFVHVVSNASRKLLVELKPIVVKEGPPSPSTRGKLAPGELAILLSLRPAEASLSSNGDIEFKRFEGTELVKLSFKPDALGREAELVAELAGYQSHRQKLKLVKASETLDVRSIVLNPLLTVQPAEARVEVNGAVLKPTEGEFALPGDAAPWRIKVSHPPGYEDFAAEKLTLEQLRQREMRIALAPNTDYWMQQGLAAASDDRHREAVEHFDKVLSFDGEHALAAYHRGKSRLQFAQQTADWKASVEDFTKFLTAAPESDEAAEALAMRGSANAKLQLRDAAIVDYEAAFARQSTAGVRAALIELLTERGRQFVEKSDFDRAVADFQKAYDFDKSSNPAAVVLADARYLRGMQRMRTDNYGDAVADLAAAVELDPTRAEIHAELGWAHQAVGKYELGVEDFAKALLIAERPEYLLGRAKLYVETDQGDAALLDLNRAIQLDPDDPNAYAERGRLFHYVLKNYDAAVDSYDTALNKGYTPKYELHSSAGDAFLTKADGVFSSGSFDQASLLYDLALDEFTAAKQQPIDGAVAQQVADRIRLTHQRCGDAFRRRALYDRADDAYTKAIELSQQQDHVSLAGRAFCRMMENQFDAAEQDLVAALELQKNFQRAHEYRALLCLRRGQMLAKLDSLREAIDRLKVLLAKNKENKLYYQMIIEAHRSLEALAKDSQTTADREMYEKQLKDLGGDSKKVNKPEEALQDAEERPPPASAA
ncbi:MAG: tetratricopeptide repeat protein [Pirellulaceae bacterium]